MRTPTLLLLLGMCLAGLVLGQVGCRQVDPPQPYAKAMGDESRPLPPMPPTWYEAKLVEGSAEWIEFTKPDLEPVDQGPGAEQRMAIQDLLAEYNGIVADGDYGELPPYFVEAQQATLEAYLEAYERFGAGLDGLAEAVGEQDGSLSPAMNELVRSLTAYFEPSFDVEQIQIVDETHAKGLRYRAGVAESSTPEMISFVQVDGEWFIDWPALRMGAQAATFALSTAGGTIMMQQAQLMAGAAAPLAAVQRIALTAMGLGLEIPEDLDMTPPPPPSAPGENPDEAPPEEPARPRGPGG